MAGEHGMWPGLISEAGAVSDAAGSKCKHKRRSTARRKQVEAQAGLGSLGTDAGSKFRATLQRRDQLSQLLPAYGYSCQAQQPPTACPKQGALCDRHPVDDYASDALGPTQQSIDENEHDTRAHWNCWGCGHADVPGFAICRICMVREQQLSLSAMDPGARVAQVQPFMPGPQPAEPPTSQTSLEATWASKEASRALPDHHDVQVIGRFNI